VVKALTALVSFLYFVAAAALVIVLIAIPVVELVGSTKPWFSADGIQIDGASHVALPVRISDLNATLVSKWDPVGGTIELEDLNGHIQVPIRPAPVWFKVAGWTGSTIGLALIVLFLHHLRRLFQRVRDGAPFDAQNATRLRWMGVLLLALCGFRSVFEFVMSAAATRALEVSSTIELGSPLRIDAEVVFIALVLIALAEIFRRGAALEDEQSLVV
jgi:hypothetical protein